MAYYENKLRLPHDEAVKRAKGGKAEPSVDAEGKPVLSSWKIRQDEKRAREEATKPHVLGLPKCPFCGAEFFRKIEDKYEPIKMDNCVPCAKRFYYYNGVKE